MFERRNTPKRVTGQVLLWDPGLREYIYLAQDIVDSLLFQCEAGDSHIHAPCGSI
ncbi:hypothetical protein LMG9964_04086 [Paraburkholderia phenoliruptrix]|uniref:Uncharacterized protein n=1 Tax=Paraburkholderia phenoliruptrix TaxID=252970 RepID=A0A6J5K8Z3_9BURK|nr:hypothetical protein LMG9964_04086 [Paraburkholderia phenoliruptrix]